MGLNAKVKGLNKASEAAHTNSGRSACHAAGNPRTPVEHNSESSRNSWSARVLLGGPPERGGGGEGGGKENWFGARA